jgi:hypothetical protein
MQVADNQVVTWTCCRMRRLIGSCRPCRLRVPKEEVMLGSHTLRGHGHVTCESRRKAVIGSDRGQMGNASPQSACIPNQSVCLPGRPTCTFASMRASFSWLI